MRKHMTGIIWLTGSRRTILRTIYTDGAHYFVAWYGEMIRVFNPYPNTTSGWRTIKPY